jgi:adenylate cyclase
MSDPRKLTTILAADAAGYSRLMGDDEQATVRTLTDYRQVFSERIAHHKGRIVDTAGDSVLAVFDSPVEAVECSVEIQKELAKRNRQLADHRRMPFRIGLNLGDVIIREDGTVYGDGVNIAARLQAIVDPGNISISASVHEQVEARLPLEYVPTGEQQVKNISKPVKVYKILDPPRLPGIGRRPDMSGHASHGPWWPRSWRCYSLRSVRVRGCGATKLTTPSVYRPLRP